RGEACPKSGTFGLKPCYGATYRARSIRPFHPARRAAFHGYRLVTHGCHRPSRTFRPHATDKPAHRHGLPYLSPRRAAAPGAARPRAPLRRRSRPLGGPAAAEPPGPPRRGPAGAQAPGGPRRAPRPARLIRCGPQPETRGTPPERRLIFHSSQEHTSELQSRENLV